MPILFAFILSLIVTIVLIPVLISGAKRTSAYDLPGERKVHTHPVPRIGGVAMAVGAFVPILLYGNQEAAAWPFLAGAAVLVAFGLIDDLIGMNWKIKFAGQIIAALVVVLYGGLRITHLGSLQPDSLVLLEWIGAFLAVFAIVGVTNAINLADGLDGLAGGLTLLMLLCIGFLAWKGQDLFIVLACAALSGAIFGFLRYNTYPATIFMGDTGSQLLGFSAVCLSLALTQGNAALSPILPLLIIGGPILDTVTVMVSRIAEGRSPFSADKGHFHHRLMGLGFYHTEAVFVLYVVQSLLVLAAYRFRFYSEWPLLGGYLAFSGLFLIVLHRSEASGWNVRQFTGIDRVKGRLRQLREGGIFIRLVFEPLRIAIICLLVLLAFLSREIPGYFALFTAAGAAVLAGSWFFFRKQTPWILTALLYLSIPFLLYFAETRPVPWMQGALHYLYELSFLLVAALGFLTLRLTRRRQGFRTNTMDYLLLFITLVLVFLPELRKAFGLLGVKTILLFFTLEIILGEIRGKFGKLTLLTVFVLSVVALRGI